MADIPKITVLIADYDEDLRHSLGIALVSSGFNVIEAQDGVEAFNHICATQIDVVVSSVEMPMVNGIDLLLNSFRAASKPLFVLIADDPNFDEQQAKVLGAFWIMRRPFKLSRLVATIKAARAEKNPINWWPQRTTIL